MRIEYTTKAIKKLKKLDSKVKKQIITAINNLPAGDIKLLQGYSDGRKRLRVGNYRIIYKKDVNNNVQILLVLDIGVRGDIYKKR